jgi:hypothetical protein
MELSSSSGFWTLVVGGATAIVGALAGRFSKADRASADTTLGHGWSEFASALKAEAQEERELRHLVETKVASIETEWYDCKRRLREVEQKYDGILIYLKSVGLEVPGWKDIPDAESNPK